MIDLNRVDNAINLARWANLHNTLSDLEAYRDCLRSNDPLTHALLTNFTLQLCAFVEERVHLHV